MMVLSDTCIHLYYVYMDVPPGISISVSIHRGRLYIKVLCVHGRVHNNGAASIPKNAIVRQGRRTFQWPRHPPPPPSRPSSVTWMGSCPGLHCTEGTPRKKLWFCPKPFRRWRQSLSPAPPPPVLKGESCISINNNTVFRAAAIYATVINRSPAFIESISREGMQK